MDKVKHYMCRDLVGLPKNLVQQFNTEIANKTQNFIEETGRFIRLYLNI